ncbi:hypothetical protein BX600DRAFT_451099 [Xylariales sp. PMI_506]|nr:hypothetical protein BX600DRAFT_451099 [Xylariales sp. PMI_506]
MKVSGRIDGSICGAILSSRPCHSSVAQAVHDTAQRVDHATRRYASIPAPTTLWDTCIPRPGAPYKNSAAPKFPACSYSTAVIRQPRRQINTSHVGAGYFASHSPCTRSSKHISTLPPQLPPPLIPLPAPKRSPEELLAFVDQYDDISVEDQLEYLRDPYMRGYAPPPVPTLEISDKAHHVSAPSPEEVENGGQDVQEIITQLRAAVFQRLLRPLSVDNDNIYHLYRSLPEPRMIYLPARLRHALLAVLGITERKNSKSMLRYFAIIADVRNSGFTLTRTEWNTALSFASRYVGTTTEVEAEASLRLWKEMEHDAGIGGNEVTFNILFDAAAKAGKFALAEMIYHEMVTRGFSFNRYHHVSLIHFFGLKMNASGVRAAYREMVQAGEIIDSVVLNCVLVGLLRSGDEASADRIYERMKAADPRSKLIPHRDYTFNKMVTKVLMMFARMTKANPEMRAHFQGAGLLSPDLSTYRILLNHYGVRRGQMSKVARYLDEMKFFRVPLHGSIFLALFKGFAIHGGASYSEWSLPRLQKVWDAFLDAFDSGAEGLYVSTWLAMWVLRAFAKCSRSRGQVLEVYDELKVRWDENPATDSFMIEFLHKLLAKNNLDVNTSQAALEQWGQGQHYT